MIVLRTDTYSASQSEINHLYFFVVAFNSCFPTLKDFQVDFWNVHVVHRAFLELSWF